MIHKAKDRTGLDDAVASYLARGGQITVGKPCNGLKPKHQLSTKDPVEKVKEKSNG